MQKKCGTKWTQLPLFCVNQTVQEISPAPLTADHANPLADFACDIDGKRTVDELWFWRVKHKKRIVSELTRSQQKELEAYFDRKTLELGAPCLLPPAEKKWLEDYLKKRLEDESAVIK